MYTFDAYTSEGWYSVMQCKYYVGCTKDGKPVANKSHNVGWIKAFSGLVDVILDILDKCKEAIVGGVAAYLGFGSAGYAEAIAAAKSVLEGADYIKTGKASLQIYEDGSFDQIQVYFQAWSDDLELKPDQCKMILVPPQAQPMGESNENPKKANWYQAKLVMNVAGLKTGVYRFIGGGQDSGFYFDDAVTSQLDITFHDLIPDKKVKVKNVPKDPNPEPPQHLAPNFPVTAEIAANYARLSTLMAEFGIYMGSAGANRVEYERHYEWAWGKSLHEIETEMVRKVRELAKFKTPFEYVFGLLSTELAKMVTFGDPHSDSLKAQGHRVWARDRINKDKNTEHVRNELLRKIYVALERPISIESYKVTEALLPAVPKAQIEKEVTAFLETFQRRSRPKRTDPRPEAMAEIVNVLTLADIQELKPQQFEGVPDRNIEYLRPLLRQ